MNLRNRGLVCLLYSAKAVCAKKLYILKLIDYISLYHISPNKGCAIWKYLWFDNGITFLHTFLFYTLLQIPILQHCGKQYKMRQMEWLWWNFSCLMWAYLNHCLKKLVSAPGCNQLHIIKTSFLIPKWNHVEKKSKWHRKNFPQNFWGTLLTKKVNRADTGKQKQGRQSRQGGAAGMCAVKDQRFRCLWGIIQLYWYSGKHIIRIMTNFTESLWMRATCVFYWLFYILYINILSFANFHKVSKVSTFNLSSI